MGILWAHTGAIGYIELRANALKWPRCNYNLHVHAAGTCIHTHTHFGNECTRWCTEHHHITKVKRQNYHWRNWQLTLCDAKHSLDTFNFQFFSVDTTSKCSENTLHGQHNKNSDRIGKGSHAHSSWSKHSYLHLQTCICLTCKFCPSIVSWGISFLGGLAEKPLPALFPSVCTTGDEPSPCSRTKGQFLMAASAFWKRSWIFWKNFSELGLHRYLQKEALRG